MQEYRELLKRTLANRMRLNPHYSLRAFSRDLKVSPSYLSQVLGGTRRLTMKSAPAVFAKLGVSDSEKKWLELQIQKDQARTEHAKKKAEWLIAAEKQVRAAHEIPTEDLERVADWQAVVLLQLLSLKAAPRKNEKEFIVWAAKKMGVQASLVQDHFDSLLKMGLIKVVNKELLPTFATVWSKNGISSHAIRKFHKQMLEKASNAIELQNIEDRFAEHRRCRSCLRSFGRF